ncbi:hypothetical protein B0H12DRAFT_1246925 [Mycena haematopus]|nr:hypothetical protein B0H12DRAFT_1246925 [Mycena haematopus]
MFGRAPWVEAVLRASSDGTHPPPSRRPTCPFRKPARYPTPVSAPPPTSYVPLPTSTRPMYATLLPEAAIDLRLLPSLPASTYEQPTPPACVLPLRAHPNLRHVASRSLLACPPIADLRSDAANALNPSAYPPSPLAYRPANLAALATSSAPRTRHPAVPPSTPPNLRRPRYVAARAGHSAPPRSTYSPVLLAKACYTPIPRSPPRARQSRARQSRARLPALASPRSPPRARLPVLACPLSPYVTSPPTAPRSPTASSRPTYTSTPLPALQARITRPPLPSSYPAPPSFSAATRSASAHNSPGSFGAVATSAPPSSSLHPSGRLRLPASRTARRTRRMPLHSALLHPCPRPAHVQPSARPTAHFRFRAWLLPRMQDWAPRPRVHVRAHVGNALAHVVFGLDVNALNKTVEGTP